MSDNNLRKPPRTRAQYVGDSASRALAVVALATIWSIAIAANDIGVGSVSPRPGALIPPVPPYGWRLEKAVMVPMRDGVRLATDLYMPVGVKPPFPVIFIKPGGYGKHFYRPAPEDRQIHGDAIDKDGEPEHADRPYFQRFGQDHNSATWFASHGYVVAVQDARGRFESEGTYTLVKDYKNDIYDTVDWLAKQPWSSQKVGMMGCSYGGEVQLYQAAHSHPALKAIIPQAGGTSVGSAGGFYSLAHIADSGILALGALAPWYQGNLLGPFQQFPRPPGITDAQWHALVPLLHVMKRPQVNWNAVYRTLPEIDIMAAAGLEPAGLELTDWRLFVPRFGDVTNAWWQQFDFVKEGDSISTPALFMDAWYDIDPRLQLYLRAMYEKTGLTEEARQNQFIVIAPTPHCSWNTATEDYAIGPLKMGDARFGYYSIYLAWFDHWLRGKNNGIDKMPKVQYFVIGKGEWRATNTWPLPNTKFTKLFLTSDGHANSQFGDGRLSWDSPKGASSDTFVYDPGNPVPTTGTPFCDCSAVIADQAPVASRDDVLVYTSPPLSRGLEITGPIQLTLMVSSNATDTDVFAKLVDVYPDGTALNIYEIARRLRFRDGRENPKLMNPGTVYEVSVQLTQTSRYFPAGHRLRLQITSSDFPAWARNLNTGGNNYDESSWKVAINTIHHTTGTASFLTLPVIP